jgi:nucleotide-binding universal stress UspA family protein
MKKPFEINKILIPIDFSETSLMALEHAANFCSKFNSSLYLLHVYKGRDIDVLPDIGLGATDHESIKKKVIDELKKLASGFSSDYGITVDIEVKEGSIAKEIATTANEVDADMIVMGTHGTSGFEEYFLGSVAYKVVTASPLPVFTVQNHAKSKDYNTIFVGIDSSAHTRDKVSHVATLAKAFGAKVHICSLITEEHEEERKIFNLKVKQIQEYLDHQGVSYENSEVHGDNIAEMVLEKAQEVGSEMIAIMTEQEASTGLFMGSYAQQIVNHSKIPVLSVTPFSVVESFSQSDLEANFRPFNF